VITGADLQRVAMFADLADADLEWIAAQCDELRLAAGEIFVNAGERAQWMFIGLEGIVQFRREHGGANAPAYTFHAGEIGGRIPFSRMTQFAGTGRAIVASRVARFPDRLFDELLRRIPVLEERMVGLLTDRVRESTRRDEEYTRTLSVGRMSAGLAHELNNPVAAARRSADELGRRVGTLRHATVALIAAGASATDFTALDRLRCLAGERTPPMLDPVSRSEREDALTAWLEACGVAEPWVSAGTFAAAGVTTAELDEAVRTLPADACSPALSWLGAQIGADSLIRELSHSTARISDLLESIKGFTQMDRPVDRESIELASSIDTALGLYGARFADKRVTVTREFVPGLPRVSVHVSELNRVWAILLSNALDAVAPGGRITVRTGKQEGAVIGEIADNGVGVPVDIQDRIWEPFFTTKDVGDGVGMGLDVARRIVLRHAGTIELRSVPGDTVFTVRLPVSGAADYPTG
jgi:signal transduction histidine kinase